MGVTGVMHLINTGGPGGAETVYVQLVRRLDPARWRSVPVLPNHEWMHEQLAGDGVHPPVLRSRVPFDVRYLARLAAIVRRERIGLVHAHFFGPAVTAGLLGRMCGIPAVATLHGEGDLEAGGGYRRLKLALLRGGVRRLVFVSEPLRRFFLERTGTPADRTRVIPNGVDADRFAPGDGGGVRAELGMDGGRFVIGAVGNVRAAKGYEVLLHAAALVRDRAPDARFVVVGQLQGAEAERLLRMRDGMGLADRVVFMGFRDDVHRVMRAFDLFVLPSLREGFSIATVQAMAAGVPVVATRSGGPETIVEDARTGVLVPPGDAAALADAVLRLRADPAARARLAAAARGVAAARFDVRAQVRAYEGLYEECLAETRAARRVRASAAALARGAE
jgi:glycosyltransferase involved in cell wall biosynthesis